MMSIRMLAAAFFSFGLLAVGHIVPAAESGKAGADSAPPATFKVPATSVATFHCLSIYWSPEKGQGGKNVLVKFREGGGEHMARGAADALQPGEDPGMQRRLSRQHRQFEAWHRLRNRPHARRHDTHTYLKASTWSEKFPVASTVKCQSGDTTLNVNKSGTPEGYILYDGTGCTIDTANNADLGISVDASYVILRGFTIKNVKQHGIRINNGHHIVIENCDISQWGSEEERGFGFEMQAGVYSRYQGPPRHRHPALQVSQSFMEHQQLGGRPL